MLLNTIFQMKKKHFVEYNFHDTFVPFQVRQMAAAFKVSS